MATLLRSESSLQRQQHRLRHEAAALKRLAWIEGSLTVLLLAGGFGRWALRGTPDLLVAGSVAALFAVGHALKRKENESDADKLEIGSAGERDMTERLLAGLPDDAFVVNDLLLAQGRRTAQIDHLAITSRGAFVVETKTWNGRLSGRLDSPFWRLQGARGKSRALKNPVHQNRRQARFLREALQAAGLDWPDVVPLVTMASPRCELALDEGAAADVSTPRETLRRIREHIPRRTYTRTDIDALLDTLGLQ